MRSLVMCCIMVLLISVPLVSAQETYENETLGVAFEVPDGWEVRAEADSITAGTPEALEQLDTGEVPESLIFRVITGTFLDMDIQNASQLPERLTNLVPTGVTAPEPTAITYGGIEGWVIEYSIADGNLTSRVALLGLRSGRLALIRGFSASDVWESAAANYDAVIDSLTFSTPADLVDPFDGIPDDDGGVYWQYQAAQPEGEPTVSLGGLTYDPFLLMYIAAGERGLLVLDESNGAFVNYLGPFFDDDNFVDVTISADARLFVANATSGDNNQIMVVNRVGAFEYGFGSTGDAPGQFAPGMPQSLAVEGGSSANVWTISEGHTTEPVNRLYKFDRFGTLLEAFDLADINPELSNVRIDNNVSTGELYLIGETGGLNLLDFNGNPLVTNLGMEIFEDDPPLDIAIAPNNNIIIATAENGFLEFSPAGELLDRVGLKYSDDRTDSAQPSEFYEPAGVVVNVDGDIFFAETNPLSGLSQVQSFSFTGDGNLPLPNRIVDTTASEDPAPDLDPAAGGGDITYGTTLQGSLNNQFPVHQYFFEGEAGDRIRITMRALDASGELDTLLRLIGPTLLEIGFSDDADPLPEGFIATDSVIEMEIQAFGRYTIEATRFGGRGDYELTFELLTSSQ